MSALSDIDSKLLEQAAALALLDKPSSKNPAMLDCLELAVIAARSSAPVLITGENGVGKSLLAASIHHHSPMRDFPCVTLHCSAVPDRDVKTRLFGDRRSHIPQGEGLLRQASGGTLVIDGVDQLPGFVQQELLTILTEIMSGQSRSVSGRVFPERNSGAGARIIATTGNELSQKTPHGLFVEDLVYRLGEITIRVPPLRERREDIGGLAAEAVRAANRAHGKNVKGLSRTATDFIRHYDFPGNVRELFLIINRAIRSVTRDMLYVEDLGLIADSSAEHPHLHANLTMLSLAEMEKRHISKALLRTGWKKRAAARILRITETTLNRKIKLHGLERGTRLD